MKIISSNIVEQLKADALEYMTSLKGDKITKEDITIAQTLIIYGYLKARLQLKKREPLTAE